MGNWSCINNTSELEQIFQEDKKMNLDEILSQIKAQLKDVYNSVDLFS